MTKKTLKFDNVEFHVSKQPIPLSLLDLDQILISKKFKHRDTGFQYFICYKDDNIVI